MAELFNMHELVGMGIEKEKKRRDFYALVADRFEDTGMKKLFTDLKNWEEAHIKRFTEIQKGVEGDEPFESYPGEMGDYTKALVDDLLYKEVSPESFSSIIKTPLDAIRRGIQFEKDAIIFFTTLEPYVGASRKGPIRTLIDEEKKHLLILTDLRRKYES